jgi:hypothetical protein
VVLVFYLLVRNGEGPSSIGLDVSQPRRDLLRGAALAAVIGGGGLGLYYLAFKAGIALNIVAANLPDAWWRIPVLLLSALQDGLLEEVLVIGYLLIPGVRRVHRQRHHGRHLRGAVHPLAAGQPDDHRALPDQRRGVRRLHVPGIPRLMAAVEYPEFS